MGSNFDIVARKAEGQHGRVAWRQLVAAGIDRHTIQRWLEDHRLHRVHDGVYAVGHTAPSPHADLMAAVLACGPEAVASHASSAHLYGIFPVAPTRPEITVPTTAGRARPGILIHRVRHLDELDTRRRHGIPTTTVARLLLDLAPRLNPPELTRACHEAWVRRGVAPPEVDACIARNPSKWGGAKLRRALGSDATLSGLEDGFLALLDRHGLPRPRTNVDHHGDKVDCHWPETGLTIELVSYRSHGSRQAFEQDIARRRRSNHVQYSWGDVHERGARTAQDVTLLLGESGKRR